MKNVFKSLVFMVIALLPSLTHAQTKSPSWQQMKDFHSIMAGTFHPAEEGNLAPLKARAADLDKSAKDWFKSPVPLNFKEKETKIQLEKLHNKTSEIAKAVAANATDESLTALITEAHDIFHNVAGECKKADQ